MYNIFVPRKGAIHFTFVLGLTGGSSGQVSAASQQSSLLVSVDSIYCSQIHSSPIQNQVGAEYLETDRFERSEIENVDVSSLLIPLDNNSSGEKPPLFLKLIEKELLRQNQQHLSK